MSNILGIDGSLSSTGWAIYDTESKDIIDCGKICTKKNNKIENTIDEDARMVYISKSLLYICNKYNVTYAKEEAQFAKLNIKTSMQLSRLRGSIAAMLSLLNIQVKYSYPNAIKKSILGYVPSNKGKEDKDKIDTKLLIYEHIINKFRNNNIVKNIGPFSDKQTKSIEKTSDIYDAISIAIADE